ncbi:GHMP family kinase ATP-binding protein [Natronorarus salvus]|uniref:GHMP family kinase ATP-binding protein n=1 Tax=Natronorarus salvus TaxID=3117733 RepID=UPI002F265412
MRAHAPGSVTGLFAPATDEVGRSRGASVAIEDGVVVDLTPEDGTRVTVEGEPAPFEPVERVLSLLEVTARVDVLPEVPLGCGFGASGAATLATALAANAEFDLGHERESLVDAAHRAERAAGTGQGDVYVQDRGGLLWSANGEVNRREVDEEVEYASAGGMSTKAMLADREFTRLASEVGKEHLDRLPDPPTLRAFAERSRAYLTEVGIATPFVERELERVDRDGGVGSMALFGETVFAVGVDGVLSNRSAVANEGARPLE